MQIEVYKMEAAEDALTITLEAVCDTFSSLLWDIEYYQCGSFEVYIAANPENLSIFQTGRIIGRDDDSQHFGIIESVQIDTDAENGDYLTVKGRFLMCLLERRIINPTLSITADTAYRSRLTASFLRLSAQATADLLRRRTSVLSKIIPALRRSAFLSVRTGIPMQ